VTPSSLAEGSVGEGDGCGNLELGGSVYFHKIHSAKQVFATLEQAQAASLLPLLLPHIFLSESGFTLIRPGMEINLDNKIEIIGKAGFQWTGPYAITVGASASGQWINTSTKTLIFDQLGKSVIYSYGRHNLVGLNLEAQVGIGFFNLVDLELVKLGASASMQVGKLGHFHFPIKATTNEELELELKEIGPLVALANADPNNAITLPYQKHEFIGSTEFVKMFNTSFYFRFFIFQWSTGESVEQRDLVYRSPSSENVQTDGDVQLESEEGNALTKRSFYSHTKQKEFKIRGIFSMFKGTMMSVADMLFTMFTGIPYATAQRSMLNYESQSNIILNGRPLELKNKSSFSYNFVHNHQSSKKGLWKILSRAKLKGLFKRYDLNGSGSAPNWQKVLGMATTPWNFTNSVSIGVGAVEFILKHQEEDVLLKVEQACQSVSCSDSELDKLLDGMKEFIGKTYHRIANENDKSVCHLRVKEQMKGHNVFWRLANKGKLIRQCFKDLTKIDPELRKFNIAAPELWNWFDQTQELKNRGQFLVNIFGNQNIQWESKLFYTISGMPFILSTARAGAQIPSPIEDAVNNLR